MSIRFDEQAVDFARRLCFLLVLFERVADGEDVSAKDLDWLVNLDPVVIEFLADFLSERNAKARAAVAAREQSERNVVSLFPSRHVS